MIGSIISSPALSNLQQNMKRVGNIASNRIYNPQNAKPPIPFDADEADSAMERFIRQKYQDRTVKAPMRNNTGSTNSDDQPPPLPPKTGSRFGFRSASSIFPLSSKSRREAEAAREEREEPPSPRRNKPSRIFGASVGSEGPDDLDSKMAKLRDMGFRDEKRNMAVLKGLGGNLEKSIETLVRLGEGASASGPVKSGEISGPSSRSRTPLSATAGLTMNRTRVETSPPKDPNNPFDMLDAPPPIAQPQSSQSTGSLAHPQGQMMGNNPYQQAANSNPFGLMPSQSQYSLNQAFQNMNVSSSQPLFPNHTGGFPGPQQPQHQQLYQHSMTPPVPSLPQQYYPSVIYENPAQQPQQSTSYNPFMQQQQLQQAPLINTNFPNNPYNQQVATPQSLYQSPMEQSPPQQFPSSVYDNGVQQQQQMNPYLNQNAPQQQQQQQMNPFLNQSNPQQMPQQVSQQAYGYQSQQPQYQQYRQQTHPLMQQQTGRVDKRSILDLYNHPQLAPSRPQAQLQQDQHQKMSVDLTASQQQRSVSSPLATPMAGSRNPFMSSGGGNVQSPGGEDTLGGMGQFGPPQNGVRHVSQESINVDTGGWTNGRHSPDAWGSISARSIR
jgi:hypothetical protein